MTAYRQSPHSDYANYRDKDELRRALVTEQRGLCCYCMGRIRAERTSMKIEHWRSQARYPDQQLNYRNLLASCHGRVHTDRVASRLTSNTATPGRATAILSGIPPTRTIASRPASGTNLTARSGRMEIFDDQLNNVLNLNLASAQEQSRGCSRRCSRLVEA